MYPIRSVLSAVCFFLCCGVLLAQKNIPALERDVTLRVSNEAVSAVLTQIANQTGIKFSYSPTHVPSDKKISLTITQKPLRTVLKIIFGETVQYKVKGNFIIITPKPAAAAQAPVKEIIVSGYVYNDSGEKLAYASILNRKEQTAAVTNQYGYYRLLVTADQLPLDLKVEKSNYRDTSFKVTGRQTQVDLVLKQLTVKPEQVVSPVDSVRTQPAEQDTVPQVVVVPDSSNQVPLARKMELLFLSEETKANIKNLKDTLFSSVQFSVIPQLSTNRLLAGNTVNDISISLLVGYSKGINVAAFSGLMNITAGKVKYAQAAGLMNIVDDSVTGGQAAGLMNIVGGSVTGGQAAGLLNIVEGDMHGFQSSGFGNIVEGEMNGVQLGGMFNVNEGNVTGAQAAGFMNITCGNVSGPQVAGFMNIADSTVHGPQVAGFMNITSGNVQGPQVAGFMNVTDNTIHGTQIGGFMNIADGDVNGSQVSGFCNVADSSVTGVQISGFMNVAAHISGVQIAPFNFSSSCSGVAIGLLSFSSKGYHKVELFSDDAGYTQFAFRTGIKQFHNVFNAGVDLTSRVDGLWNFGYGIGSYHRISDNWNFGGDIMTQMFLKGDQINYAPQLNTLHLGFERTIGKCFAFDFGPSFHVLVNYGSNNTIANVITPYSFYDRSFNDGTALRMWVGGKVSLRFL